MTESTTPAQTSDDLWNKARDAGLFSATQGTNAFDLAIDRFAAAVRASVPSIKDGGPAFPVADPMQLDPANVKEMKRLAEGMPLRAYLAAHADVSEFDLGEHVLEMRAARATYSSEPMSAAETAEAIADLKVMQADALIRRLARDEA